MSESLRDKCIEAIVEHQECNIDNCSACLRRSGEILDAVLNVLTEHAATLVLEQREGWIGVTEQTDLTSACYDEGPYWSLDPGTYLVLDVTTLRGD